MQQKFEEISGQKTSNWNSQSESNFDPILNDVCVPFCDLWPLTPAVTSSEAFW